MLRIIEYTKDHEFEDFKKNYLVVDAVVRNFEIIGEASKNIPEVFKKSFLKSPGGKYMD